MRKFWLGAFDTVKEASDAYLVARTKNITEAEETLWATQQYPI